MIACTEQLTAMLPGKLRANGTSLGFLLGALALLVVAPAVLSDFRLSLLGRFICYAIVAVGVIVMAWAQSSLSENFPSFWTYFQGALFVLVVAFLRIARRLDTALTLLHEHIGASLEIVVERVTRAISARHSELAMPLSRT